MIAESTLAQYGQVDGSVISATACGIRKHCKELRAFRIIEIDFPDSLATVVQITDRYYIGARCESAD